MADSEDLKLLHAGERNLSRCDFREADLSGMNLSSRDFTKALLNKANCRGTDFSDSDFGGAEMSFMHAPHANFARCKLQDLHFGYCDYHEASFKDAEANKARFQNIDLSGADLTGASFVDGEINIDTKLQGVIADKSTNFEGLKVLRATSRDPLFSTYRFENGRLRKINPAKAALDQGMAAVPLGAYDGANKGQMAVPAADRLVRLDHNQPEYVQVVQGLNELYEQIRQDNQIGETAAERDRLLKSLGAARQLWSATELHLLQIRVGVVMAIEDAGSAATRIGKAVGAGLLVDLIKRIVKQSIGIEF